MLTAIHPVTREDAIQLAAQSPLSELLAAATALRAQGKGTGLLPHATPGLMDQAGLKRLKASNASVGLLLESVSPRLMRDGLPHAKAADKVPALRLRTIEEAGKLSIAFTTGILIGIGET